jgi:hypothetical protein
MPEEIRVVIGRVGGSDPTIAHLVRGGAEATLCGIPRPMLAEAKSGEERVCTRCVVETRAIAAASAAGIGLDGLATGGYYERPGPAGLLVGYGAAAQHTFRAAVEALVSALSDAFAGWQLPTKGA